MVKRHSLNVITGISIVVANMVGTGAFTSLGFQLDGLSNTTSILTLWILGGVLALSGAFSYAEVGTVIKKSGGEYVFLEQLYHPLVGYLSCWISISVGFAAPIALSTIAFIEYLPWHIPFPKTLGVIIIGFITWIHSQNLKLSSNFQNIFTLIKVLLIIVFLVIALSHSTNLENLNISQTSFLKEVTSGAFAVSLIYVSYSYSGWNAAVYITEEFKNPIKTLPRALIGGTLMVTILYTLLQYSFLKHVSQINLINKVNVGAIVAKHLFGEKFSALFSSIISLFLISGISAMIWVGPKVTAKIALRYSSWRYFRENKNGIPVRASWLQFGISVLLLITGTFDQILIYCGVLLSISSLLVVVGVFKIRKKNMQALVNHYQSPAFPLFQILYIILSVWVIVFTFINKTYETSMGLINLIIGAITWFFSLKYKASKNID